MEVRYTCAEGSGQEWLYLTKSGSILWPPEADIPPTQWVLGIDTCDDGHHPSGMARGICTDGGADRFDDTTRSVVLHKGVESDGAAHRPTCRNVADVWAVWEAPGSGKDRCQDEHHFIAEVDLYFFEFDPTGGLWDG